MAKITLKGNAINTNGNLPAQGAQAPDFTLVAGDLSEQSLSGFAGKKKVISIVPSLDTPVCATSTQKFNEQVTGMQGVQLIVVSADLPFAQGRFCEANSTKEVATLSTMRNQDFASDYGVLIVDGPLAGLTARAVLVLDENNQVLHSELVSEIADEPDYDAALNALN